MSTAFLAPYFDKVDIIQVAAALHWFNPTKFYRECDRVLVPGGVIAIFSYTIEEFIVVDHPRAAEISKVLKEINSKLASKENPHYAAQQDLVKRKYTDSVLQIPNTDKTRIDNKYVTVRTTISGLFRFYRTLSHVKPFINSCPENWECGMFAVKDLWTPSVQMTLKPL
ncbi:hypothetical protein EB796_024860 [Bugula neritina]|uniref:Methyltransferase type 11 domain-containing protein n=1 Tax=Bugula neritina TaxID=10212 RepID=A0A7J7ITV6_BUGNE|nr:hypothetical protein EB796_024860 [Bugula neritina]